MFNVFWWSKPKLRNEEYENFGDFLVPYLLSKTTTEKFRWVKPNTANKLEIFRKRHYFVIGSILHFATDRTIVWGAGIIASDIPVKNAKFLAVRGPKTRKKLLELGYKVPPKFGDPAVLLALFKSDYHIEIKYKIGVVPHFVDFKKASKVFADRKEVNLINVLTKDPENVLNAISQCEFILSSSLHGIIVSHALGIPSIWVKISNELYGDDIKFYDYYESVGIEQPRKIPFASLDIGELEKTFMKNKNSCLPDKEKLDLVIKDLIETFPFKKSKEFRKRIHSYFS